LFQAAAARKQHERRRVRVVLLACQRAAILRRRHVDVDMDMMMLRVLQRRRLLALSVVMRDTERDAGSGYRLAVCPRYFAAMMLRSPASPLSRVMKMPQRRVCYATSCRHYFSAASFCSSYEFMFYGSLGSPHAPAVLFNIRVDVSSPHVVQAAALTRRCRQRYGGVCGDVVVVMSPAIAAR